MSRAILLHDTWRARSLPSLPSSNNLSPLTIHAFVPSTRQQAFITLLKHIFDKALCAPYILGRRHPLHERLARQYGSCLYAAGMSARLSLPNERWQRSTTYV
jgi:hypothetical protein